ncbi:hypothetical protein IJ098_00525 [Candidatus Saccharibacteria bacterium]|nr:hypothetical protein [Candidatus Saccharibacteria bacterium]MBQ8984330.1 hypothetical protein [Candidatus Saccharibacteria bacterium]
MREIIAVYQDCVLCGAKGRQKIADYAAQGIQIRKVGFTTPEGRELCYQAVQKGIGYMPFYVSDGDFAESIEALIPKQPKIVKKVRKTAVLEKKSKITDRKTGNGDKTNN